MLRRKARLLTKSIFASILTLAIIIGFKLSNFDSVIVQASTQATYYVSVTGSDSNNGTSPSSPFATVEKARDVIRTINSSMTGDIIVYVMAGDYYLNDTITFTNADSGTNGYDIIYQNYNTTGSARFIIGTKVTGWTLYSGNIYKANVGTGLAFKTLYENGVRADMARWPKHVTPFATSRAGYMTFTSTPSGGPLGYVDYAYNPTGIAFDSSTLDLTDAYCYNWAGPDGHRWTSQTSKLSLIGTALNNSGCSWPIDSFLIENSLDLLSSPGEYFYDSATGYLYYYSRFNGLISDQEIIAPKAVRAISLVGTSETSVMQNVIIKGFTFTGGDRILTTPLYDWGDNQQASYDALVYVQHATNITIENCKITGAGINAVTLDYGATYCTVTGSLIEHAGYSGVSLRGYYLTVSNCRIRYIGETNGMGRGVTTGTSPSSTSTNGINTYDTLSNLDIYYVARAGVGLGSRFNTVSYVRAHECIQDSGDQGAFYQVAPAGDNTYIQCYSYHNYNDATMMDRPATGIYSDRDAANTTYTNCEAVDNQYYNYRHDPQDDYDTGSTLLTFTNCSWDMTYNYAIAQSTYAENPDFNRSLMEYDNIGVTSTFPTEYNDVNTAPNMPINFYAQAGNTQVTLKWTQCNRASSYNVKRSTSLNGTYTTVGTVYVPETGWDLGTEFRDTGLTNGTTYYYKVSAVNSAGESAASIIISTTPSTNGSGKLNGTVIGTVSDPEKAFDGNLNTCSGASGWVGLDLGTTKVITGIKYTPNANNVQTSWGQIQGSSDADFTNPVTLYVAYSSKAGAVTILEIPGAVTDTTAYRYIRYIPSGSYLATIAEIQVFGYEPGGSATPPATPSNLGATPINASTINLSWDAVTGANKYYVYRSTSENGLYTMVNSSTTTSCADSSLSENTTYYYKITAANAIGESGLTWYVSATTQLMPEYTQIEGESYSGQSGTQLENCGEGGQDVCYISNGDYCYYNNVDLTGVGSIDVRVSCPSTVGSTVQIRLGSTTGTLIGTATVPVTGAWQTYQTVSVDISSVSGTQNLYLVFTGGGFNLNWFKLVQLTYPQIEGENYSSQNGINLESCRDYNGGKDVCFIGNGDYTFYSSVNTNFVNGIDIRVACPSTTGSYIEVREGSTTGTLLGTVNVPVTGNWQAYTTVTAPISGATGTKDIYLVYKGGGFNVNWFKFVSQSFAQIEAEAYSGQSGIQTENCSEGGLDVCYISNGDYTKYSSVDINYVSGIDIRVACPSATGCTIEVREGSTTGTLLGTVNVPVTGNWQTFTTATATISGASGTNDIYLVYKGGTGNLFNVNWFQFN